MHNIVAMLQNRAQKSPAHNALLYLEDGEYETPWLSYGELDRRARAIAAYLQAQNRRSCRVILFFPSGIEFTIGLMGCWYAGAIAVPIPCPNKVDDLDKHLALFHCIAEDAEATTVLTTEIYSQALEAVVNKEVLVLTSDIINLNTSSNYQTPPLTDDSIAYLQYTSGSTSAPKAAIVTHGNLKHSLSQTIKAWHYNNKSVTLNWAPHTHVYGLVCGLLVPLYHGSPAIIMAPAVFIQKPVLWLKAISKYRASHGGGPNFGYDLCVRDINEAELAELDLKPWKVAVNGGEIVQQKTLSAFASKFQICGFALTQFASAYGMSEVTGAIATTYEQIPTTGQQQRVSSGKLLAGLHAIAVDPESGFPVAAGDIGEIWLSGKSVVSGYWRRPEENHAVFKAQVPGDQRHYFKTGDLGFISANELYLTGRLKEVMVIYGKKYYPLDFEITIAETLKQFQLNVPQIVFSTDIGGQEKIIVVQELDPDGDPALWQSIQDAIHHGLMRQHGVDVHEVILTPKGAIPRTGSGKLQRKKCQQAYEAQTLTRLHGDNRPQATVAAHDDSLKAHFSALVAKILQLELSQIDLYKPLSRYAFDSINIIKLISLLNEHYQLNLSPATLYEYATLAAFYNEVLANQTEVTKPSTPPPHSDACSDIAIIGMSGSFPKAADVDTLWENLSQAKDCISEVPASRWDWRNLTVQWGGFMESVDQFDASFFNISPREAELIDPQQRLFLQTVWKTIEDAGYTSNVIAAIKTGLFVGVFNHDYAELLQQNEVMDAYLTTGTMNSMIANRISYCLNLRGPSEAIDTACSSSLVAIHQAVNAILQGDCELAIAGGVNTLLTPTSFISAHKAGMLSEDGRCKTFDKQANGYVRGEGVGAILLKKLTTALEDGDHIYGVIKGTAINHGGQANSLTAPNPNAQAEVIVAACQRAQVPVNTINYIETHGTGTPLGDPIEINGLKKAFQQLAKEQNLAELPPGYCGLGSVKTHIGHLESAAGVTGVIKVLLSMHHEEVPANLHLQELNPYIDIKDSPFYLLEQPMPWPKRPEQSPRRAGVSSFGFGGTNAHVILEESPSRKNSTAAMPAAPYLITLSAMTSVALHQRMADLLNWLQRQSDLPCMAALSYTLNAGRQHFDKRFAVIVEHVGELTELLQFILSDTDATHNLSVAPHPEALVALRDTYLQGKSIDWQQFYGNYQQRISLPSYPFAQESYWLEQKSKTRPGIHPLIDENISTLNAPAFSKQFTGKEFYLSEHQVHNESVLPGVVCLEMARVAADLLLVNQGIVTSLRQIFWKKPIKATDLAQSLQIHLTPEIEGISFALSNPQKTQEYVSGHLHYQAEKPRAPLATFDLQQLLLTLPKQQSTEEIYSYFKQSGLVYGPEFQVIQSLDYDETQLLAKLALPNAKTAALGLYPSLFDGIFHCTQALLKNRQALYLPFALEQMDIYAHLPETCYVYAQRCTETYEEQFPNFDLQVTDHDGALLLAISGFTLCALDTPHPAASLGYYQPLWQEAPLRDTATTTATSLLILGSNPATIKTIQAQFTQTQTSSQLIENYHLPNIKGRSESIPEYILLALEEHDEANLPIAMMIQKHLAQTYYLLNSLIAAVIKLKPEHQVHILCISKEGSIFARALAGLAKSLHREQPLITCRILEMHDLQLLTQELEQEAMHVRYDQQNRRYTNSYVPLPAPSTATATTTLKQAGVYLITGGLGGLGYLVAQHLALHHQAKLVVSGRSSLSETQLKQIADLEQQGAAVLYVQADVSRSDEAQALIRQTKQHFGVINGIIHAAGITQDGFIGHKTMEAIAAVLAPKVQGACYLHAASSKEALDFFVVFSSVAAIFGNAGQSDYAYANCFLDAFAQEREQQRSQGHCSGLTLSINWPFWEDGGMALAPEYRQELERNLGIVSLSKTQGLTALMHALEHAQTQCIVLPGYQGQLRQALERHARVAKTTAPSTANASPGLHAQTEGWLKALIAESVKLAPAQLDKEQAFEHYGIDSLMIIQLNQRLEQEFSGLPKTLFFEYQNLATLTDYFVKYHAPQLALRFSTSSPIPQGKTPSSSLTIPTKRLQLPRNQKTANSVTKDDIAIIGISGRFPQAQNLAEFWDNLQAGKDCITEIPSERWDLLHYFAAEKDALGKTYSKWGGFLQDVDKFDPLFFNISPREAALMDPQERLFLETAWQTIEDAGYAREQLAGGKVGVYVGVMYGEYQLFASEYQDSQHFAPTNSVFASIANRVSYFFDFHGPSIALDTMCSSSLTAIHLACQSLREGECQLALAGGVNLSLHPNKYLLLSHGKFLASDGHCRSFGEGGDGYVPGEAVGAVLLKPLSLALQDGDNIYAVIKGSQLNHGGKTNGYTVPNPNAQAELIAATYQKANLSPTMVSYVEAHGTGTTLGDPIEIAGLNKVFKQDEYSQYALGSVKANIGHCEAAAGIAAIAKVVLQLHHQRLVPSILSTNLNSNIDWSNTPFTVQQSLSEWPRPPNGIRIAGISSFGAGGANAHVILAEAPHQAKSVAPAKSHYLLTLSAKTEMALKQRAHDLRHWLTQHPTANLQQISYTLNAGRSHFDYRCALVASTIDEAIQLLQQLDAPTLPAHLLMQLQGNVKTEPKVISHTIIPLLLQQLASGQQYQDNLVALAKFYVDGYTLDWQQVHAQETLQKIALPTYPFAKERYWYSDTEQLTVQEIEAPTSLYAESFNEKVRAFLIRQVSQLLNIAPQRLVVEKSLGDYGMDSVHFIELAKRISKHYKAEFTPAIFYTHSSILEISQYLRAQFPEPVTQAHAQVISPSLTKTYTPKVPPFQPEANHDIAIIGIHGIFPQSADLTSFWQHLLAGHDLITEVPQERWDWRTYYGDSTQHPHKSNSKWGGFIQDMEQFDASFFNLSAREANLMDPQHRLFLESVWKSIEDAGYNPLELGTAKVGVFAGVEFSEYQTLIAKQQKEFHGFIATGNSHSMLANRVSYFFNFQGPSEAVDTACSSSLVAIHRAVQAIRYGECELAIAGGVSLMLNPDTLVVTSQLGALSADGRCKTFDKSANGYVKGEGVGSILLKPLAQAQQEGDHIYAIIKASAVNHGGKAQSLTAPNAKAQSELLINAYTQANISPETISYIETHGTGTALGDPAEIEGLKLAFASLLGPQAKPCSIGLGSVKTNIGHLEPASGIAGLLKLILAMTHEQLPGLLHLQELNPFINLADSPFYIAQETQRWTRSQDATGQEIPLRAGISSFGFGGTNAHVVLEEGRPHQPPRELQQAKPYYLLTLSAKQASSLQQQIKALKQWLEQQQNPVSLSSLSFTLNQGRAHFLHRCALVVASVEELLAALNSLSNAEIPEFCLLNEGQTYSMQGPVLHEIYQATLNALHPVNDASQYRHKLFILADLYTKHYPIDWPILYAREPKQRIASLPAYSFVKQRYWYDLELQPTPATTTTPPLTVTNSAASDVHSWALNYLKHLFAEKLRTTPELLDANETYEVYGVDSLIGLEITNRLEKDFGNLPKTLLYERNRLKDLATYLLKKHHERLLALGANASLAVNSETPAVPIVAEIRGSVTNSSRDIAIIGLSGTFPMASTMDEFWQNLSSGRDCVGQVPSERWDYKQYPLVIGGKEHYLPHGGFIPDVDKFDPLFFNISPRDAGLMDPQERLFMQSVWSTLEDAGYTREKLKYSTNNAVGVFAGVTYNFYPLFIAEEWQKGNRVPLDIQSFSIANRISYFLDINGPSFVVDTACSSSLAAIHLACESIVRGECAMAIAGGVNLSLHPSKYHFLGSFNFMSEQGRCTSFAEGGTGYVPAEGVGSVLLKPLDAALADNDTIYGVIKGSSMNHGGKTSGYTVPNPNAQAAVILQALKTANINPRTISYIEAHGTGTSLGDPIEIRGLQEAFESYSQDTQYCAIGSVKSNIGHLESAAGISQLAKVLLQMRHQQLAPSLHAEQLNPFIDFQNSPFYVQRELQEWKPENNMARRAGLSSFGAGGANVHMIVEEYQPPNQPTPTSTGPYLFVLSALNEDRLRARVQQMREYLQNNPHTDAAIWLQNACYTLQVGREAMSARLAIVAANKAELLATLTHYPQTATNMWVNLQATNSLPPAELATLMQEARQAELAHHWVAGVKIDWQQLHASESRRIVSLPTYPFTKRRCWIPTAEITTVAPKNHPSTTAPVMATAPSLDTHEWLYATHWQKTPLAARQNPRLPVGKWLIFSDQELGLLLQEELGGNSCIYCFAGEQYSQHNQQVYYINPEQKTDYLGLFAAIHQEYAHQLQGVIYLNSRATTEPTQDLFYLFKAMIQHTWAAPLRFVLVSQSAQQVNDADCVDIGQHPLWSMTRIFAAEQANYQVLLLDLDAKASLRHNAQNLVKELGVLQAQQNHIAYREQERYSIRFSRESLAADLPAWTPPVAALITGGLGALGYEVAEYVVAQGTRFVLLTGATELSTQTSEKNHLLQQLTAKGIEVKYAAVDVADQEKMRRLIQETERTWQQQIDGVFHLAGITTDNVPIAEMKESLWHEVLKVKMQGALVLHELFRQAPISSFVLFSSIAAVPHFGMAGLSAYAVANEFLSGLALYRRSQHLPALSINWVAWSEKGMSHRHNHDAFLDAVGMASLNIKDGISLLHTLLRSNPAEVTVCKLQWKKFFQVNPSAKQLDFFADFAAEYAPSPQAAVVSNLFPEQIASLVLQLLAQVLALEINEIDAETPFEQYGMDSITGISYTEQLGTHFPDVVSPMDLYRYPNLQQLSEYIMHKVQIAASATPSPTLADAQEELNLEHLDYDQLNELLEAELKELELAYD
ncbi:SDR family NAD(P)-dependent oxidoreductase [Legionella lytica]|uniref:SDR family NAD(P)-dependent oxidoreductase n=1 Tax=Legionella lytica TaxID=96232 RepID=A0ABW8D7N5_9GAMM